MDLVHLDLLRYLPTLRFAAIALFRGRKKAQTFINLCMLEGVGTAPKTKLITESRLNSFRKDPDQLKHLAIKPLHGMSSKGVFVSPIRCSTLDVRCSMFCLFDVKLKNNPVRRKCTCECPLFHHSVRLTKRLAVKTIS
jgi:hypothetical protein